MVDTDVLSLTIESGVTVFLAQIHECIVSWKHQSLASKNIYTRNQSSRARGRGQFSWQWMMLVTLA